MNVNFKILYDLLLNKNRYYCFGMMKMQDFLEWQHNKECINSQAGCVSKEQIFTYYVYLSMSSFSASTFDTNFPQFIDSVLTGRIIDA